MKKRIIRSLLVAALLLLLSGCSMRTADQLYCLPKRSDDYRDLQAVMDKAMAGMEYFAPISGENQQTVQLADLDGDGQQEYLLFARANEGLPLRILIFRKSPEGYRHVDTLMSNGTAFCQVSYVQMDNRPGVELVVGRQLSDRVIRTLCVYGFDHENGRPLFSANYSNYIPADLDGDGCQELLTVLPGLQDGSPGLAKAYGLKRGEVERSVEVNLSVPVDQLKRMITGKLADGKTAVYVASAVADSGLITDVYTLVDGVLKNVSISSESGTSIRTLRNYYIYADDIDNDGVVELPSLVPMGTQDQTEPGDHTELIRWFSLSSTGEEQHKLYTYHNFADGWYLELRDDLAQQVMVVPQGNCQVFYIWNRDHTNPEKILTVHYLNDPDRHEQASEDSRFVLHTSDSVIIAADLTIEAERYGIDLQLVVQGFHLIHLDWNLGET